MKTSGKAYLFGLGLDNQDGHIRITRGKNFRLYGGSRDTHAVMQEKAIKFNEHLKQRGKNLDSITSEEFAEIADKLGLKPHPKKRTDISPP